VANAPTRQGVMELAQWVMLHIPPATPSDEASRLYELAARLWGGAAKPEAVVPMANLLEAGALLKKTALPVFAKYGEEVVEVEVAAPVAPVTPVAVPVAPKPELSDEELLDSAAGMLSVASGLLNPPYTEERVQQAVTGLESAAVAAELSEPSTVAIFQSLGGDKIDAIEALITKHGINNTVGRLLRDASWAILYRGVGRVERTLQSIHIEGGVETYTSVVSALDNGANALNAALDAANLSHSFYPQREKAFRGALREAVDHLWNAAVGIAPLIDAPVPTYPIAMDGTGREQETPEVKGPQGPAQGGEEAPLAPPAPASTGFVLWVPIPSAEEPTAMGAGGTKKGDYDFIPLADIDAARALAKAFISAGRQTGNAITGNPANYRAEPYVPQVSPDKAEAAVSTGYPTTEELISVFDQFVVRPDQIGSDFSVDVPTYDDNVGDMVDYLDSQYGEHDWSEDLIKAAQTRREGLAETNPDLCVYWTKAQNGDLAGTTRTSESDVVDGNTWNRVLVPQANVTDQLAAWGLDSTYTDADFQPLRAGDSAKVTVERPDEEPAPVTGMFVVQNRLAYIDAVALERVASAEDYTLVKTVEGIHRIVRGQLTLCVNTASDPSVLPVGGTVYAITQLTPTVPPDELPGSGVFCFLKDLQKRGYANPVPGTRLEEAIRQTADANGGLSVEELDIALQSALPAYLEWSSRAFAVPTFQAFVDSDRRWVSLTLAFAKTKDDDPDPFVIKLRFEPIEENVHVHGKLDIGGEEFDEGMTLHEALDPSATLATLLQLYIAKRPDQFGLGSKAPAADDMRERAMEAAFEAVILNSAKQFLATTWEQGVRGLPLEETL